MSGLKGIFDKSQARALLIAAALSLVASQILIASHAAHDGHDPHDHYGQSCVLCLAAPGGDKIIAAAAFAFVTIIAFWRIAAGASQTERARIAVRAAKPRGPPSL